MEIIVLVMIGPITDGQTWGQDGNSVVRPLHQSNSPPDLDKGRPRKQSTSFEHEEPAPSNLTRLPRTGGWNSDSPNSSLNRSRSPTRFGEDERYVELTVLLKRQESGFGFRIIGGTEEGSQVGETVSSSL